MKRFHVGLAHRTWWEITYWCRRAERWDGRLPLPRTPSPRLLAASAPAQRCAEAVLVVLVEGVFVHPWATATTAVFWLAFGPKGWPFIAPPALAGAAGLLAAAAIMSAERSVIVILAEYVKARLLIRRIRRLWPAAMHNARLCRADANGEPKARSWPTAHRVRATPYGAAATVRGSVIGADAALLADRRREILSTLRARDLKATDAAPGTIHVELRIRDPLEHVVRLVELEQPPPSAGLKIATGRDDSGLEVVRDPRLPSLGIGAQGAGKSSEAWTVMRALQERGVPLRLRIFDPKHQEFAPLAGQKRWTGDEWERLGEAAYQYEDDPLAWPDFIGKACGGLAARQVELAQMGVKELIDFTYENPFELMIIDELIMCKLFGKQDVTFRIGSKKVTLSAEDAFRWYLSQARAGGASAYALSQDGTKGVIGDLRPLFTYMTCYRVGQAEDSMVDVVLGGGTSKRYPAHQLPADRRSAGIGYTVTDAGIVRYRAAYLTDLERAAVARQAAADTKAHRAARRAA